jgi:NADPH-dependent 2,4-dienoyl-CoA reductase/sulfur reductase-like enzyme
MNPTLPMFQRDDSHAGVKSFSQYSGPIEERCDVVVVGSGPGGAVAAKEMAEAGMDVILLEEGQAFRPEDFIPDAMEA